MMRLVERWSVLLVFLAMALPAVGNAQQEVVEEKGGAVVREVSADGAESDLLLDEEGRVIAERLPDGSVVRYLYDSDGVRYVVDEEATRPDGNRSRDSRGSERARGR